MQLLRRTREYVHQVITNWHIWQRLQAATLRRALTQYVSHLCSASRGAVLVTGCCGLLPGAACPAAQPLQPLPAEHLLQPLFHFVDSLVNRWRALHCLASQAGSSRPANRACIWGEALRLLRSRRRRRCGKALGGLPAIAEASSILSNQEAHGVSMLWL